MRENNRKYLWDLIKDQSADLFYFIHNYQNNFENSKFWIVFDHDQPNGIVLYDGQTLKISGSPMAVDLFLESIDFNPKYINIPRISTEVALNHIESSKRKLDMIRLTMKPQYFGNLNGEGFTSLNVEELGEALFVFQKASPEDWSSTTVSDLQCDTVNRWYGIRINENLVSVCWNQFYHHGGHVAFIATHPDFQNQGNATFLLKLVLTENFKENNFAIIHVREENTSAYHCYVKVGYQEHCRYTVFCEPIMRV